MLLKSSTLVMAVGKYRYVRNLLLWYTQNLIDDYLDEACKS